MRFVRLVVAVAFLLVSVSLVSAGDGEGKKKPCKESSEVAKLKAEFNKLRHESGKKRYEIRKASRDDKQLKELSDKRVEIEEAMDKRYRELSPEYDQMLKDMETLRQKLMDAKKLDRGDKKSKECDSSKKDKEKGDKGSKKSPEGE